MSDLPLKLADRTWPLLSRLMGGHAALYRATRGRIGHHIPGLPPVCLLYHTGARSGARRTTPLLYARDGENVVLIASKGGYARNPAWYHNLRANPAAEIQVGAERWPVRARRAEGAERERLWKLAAGIYPGYEQYQARTERRIPVMVLEPEPAAT